VTAQPPRRPPAEQRLADETERACRSALRAGRRYWSAQHPESPSSQQCEPFAQQIPLPAHAAYGAPSTGQQPPLQQTSVAWKQQLSLHVLPLGQYSQFPSLQYSSAAQHWPSQRTPLAQSLHEPSPAQA
jgi:hypothetical protein